MQSKHGPSETANAPAVCRNSSKSVELIFIIQPRKIFIIQCSSTRGEISQQAAFIDQFQASVHNDNSVRSQ